MLGNHNSFEEYVTDLRRKWIKIILILGIVLVPLFGILDKVIMPSDKLHLFWALRGGATIICILQYMLIKRWTPDKIVILHAYLFTFVVGGMISYMTTHLGGFESSYYAGLNLVLIAVNFFLPWNALMGAINGIMIIVQYVLLNLLTDTDWQVVSMVNNLFFMGSTVIIAVTIGHHKYNLTKSEFQARTSLWGEMEIAKKIQTALLPRKQELLGYEVSSIMLPADEVGGDYFDYFEPEDSGIVWICVGDVSGHGVTAGLVMMMTQTSVSSIVQKEANISPSQVLIRVNQVLKENISRLGEAKYLTISALKLKEDTISVAGLHQDILIYRQANQSVETFKTRGFWLGIKKDIDQAFFDDKIKIETGDLVLLYTDGVTELADEDGPMYGLDRLKENLKQSAAKSNSTEETLELMLQDIKSYSNNPDDDISMVLLKKK